MADIPSPISVSAVAERLGRPLNAISAVRAALIRKGMIYSPSHGMVSFTVPLFGDYMRRILPSGEFMVMSKRHGQGELWYLCCAQHKYHNADFGIDIAT